MEIMAADSLHDSRALHWRLETLCAGQAFWREILFSSPERQHLFTPCRGLEHRHMPMKVKVVATSPNN
jgi:hypothetical protein